MVQPPKQSAFKSDNTNNHPVLSQVTPAVDGHVAKDAVKFSADWTNISSYGGTPSGNVAELGASSQFVEFPLPRTAGKITDFILQMNGVSTTATAATHYYVLPPSAYWFDRVEIQYNGTLVEQIPSDLLFNECASFQTNQEFLQVAPLINLEKVMGTIAGTPAAVPTANTSTGIEGLAFNIFGGTATAQQVGINGNLYLPFTGILGSIQPFMRGFNGDWRLRFYWARNIVPTVLFTGTGLADARLNAENAVSSGNFRPVSSAIVAATSSTAPTVEVNGCRLYLRQATLDDDKTNALVDLHKNGTVVYRGLKRVFHNYVPATGMAESQETQVVLTALAQSSASLFVNITSSKKSTEDLLTRYPLTTLYLKDSGGVPLSPELPAELVENWISATAVPIPSFLINSQTYTNYFIPFASNVTAALYGAESGVFYFSGQEQLVYGNNAWTYTGPIASAPTSVEVKVYSYDYCNVTVTKGDMMLTNRKCKD